MAALERGPGRGGYRVKEFYLLLHLTFSTLLALSPTFIPSRDVASMNTTTSSPSFSYISTVV